MKIFTKKKVIIGIVALVVLGLVYANFTDSEETVFDSVVVERGELIQEVSVTGTVEPVTNVDLAFEKNGTIAYVYKDVGHRISAGEPLVALEDAGISADLEQAKASLEVARAGHSQYKAALDIQKAKLEELEKGAQAEEITLAEIKVANEEKDLEDAEINLINVEEKAEGDLENLYDEVSVVLAGAYAKTYNAVSRHTDDFFTDDSTFPKFSFNVTENSLEVEAQEKRSFANTSLAVLKNTMDSIGADTEQAVLDAALVEYKENLESTIKLFDALDAALDSAAIYLTSSVITTHKTSVSTGKNDVVTALTSVNTQIQEIDAQKATNQSNILAAQASLNTAKNALASAQAELVLKQASTRPEQIAAQKAQVRQAQANILSQVATVRKSEASLQSAEADYRKYTLYSPISGVVTLQDAKRGEYVSAAAAISSVMSDANFHIETYVPEVDIAKVKVNNTAIITLDAYGDDVEFKAKVVAINPAETIIDGVTTYKTTLEFLESDKRIKSGMTANIDIATDSRENIIVIPQRAVIRRNGEVFVRTVDLSGEIQETPVITGLRGSDGRIEILEGIEEGDSVIIYMESTP